MSAPVADRGALLLAALTFSAALGVATVTIPLVALAAGYDAAAVGLLAAVAAAVQLAARLALPILLGRFADRTLIAAAGAMMAGTFATLLVSTALPAFVLAQVLQGAARAIFWTSSQTHTVRGQPEAVRGLVELTLAGNVGTLAGPVIAGFLGTVDLALALAAGVMAGTGAVLVAAVLHAHPPFDRARGAGILPLLRREGVGMAAWASAVGGGWWSMLGSYVPVLLAAAGFRPDVIGLAVTASEGAGTLALAALRRVPAAAVRGLLAASTAGVVLALAAFAIAPASISAYLVVLVLGGAASGSVTALAPAVASLAARPEEQGDALALSGTFRAAALLGSPAAMAGLVTIVPVSVALAALGAILVTPGLALGPGLLRRAAPRAGDT